MVDWLVVEGELVEGKEREGKGFALCVCVLTLRYNAACAAIKRLWLSAGVRRVTRRRWDDAVPSHTPTFRRQ